jgi:hypothetical protein
MLQCGYCTCWLSVAACLFITLRVMLVDVCRCSEGLKRGQVTMRSRGVVSAPYAISQVDEPCAIRSADA